MKSFRYKYLLYSNKIFRNPILNDLFLVTELLLSIIFMADINIIENLIENAIHNNISSAPDSFNKAERQTRK